jgi:hypothetical protein
VEAMMTVLATLTQQHRNVLAYLPAACEAVLCDVPAPALLPIPGQLHEIMRSAAYSDRIPERLRMLQDTWAGAYTP